MDKIIKVTLFAVAFAFVEAAVVVYLRHLLGASQPAIEQSEILLLLPGVAFLEPQTAIKIIAESSLLKVEQIREFMTVTMLFLVAMLAGKKISQTVAYFFLAFGVWDIFYYIFLKLTIGWPQSFSNLDIFFLLPTPWVGPVFVPVTISSILVLGSLVYLLKNKLHTA